MKKLMTSTVVCAAVLLAGSPGLAEEPDYRFEWMTSYVGPCCADMGVALRIDDEGGIFIAGHRGGLDLDRDGSIDVPTHGSPESLVYKSIHHGQEAWVHGAGGPGRDNAVGIAPDFDGGAYVVGLFEQSLQTTDETLMSAGDTDGYLMRCDETGRVLWTRTVGGKGADRLDGVDTDDAGNVYVVGTLGGPVDLDGDGAIDVEITGQSTVFLASFDPDGQLRWWRASSGQGRELGRTITVGSQGETYIGGLQITGALDLDNDGEPEAPAPTGPPDGFFARFDPSGELQWTRVASGPGINAAGSLAIAGNGDLLVLGGHTNWIDLDGDGDPDVEHEPLGVRKFDYFKDFNAFLARFTAEGAMVWVRRYAAYAQNVIADETRIVISGMYNGPLDLDDDGVMEQTADPDAFLEGFSAILDNEGRIRHVFTIVGEDSDEVHAAAFTPDGEYLYLTGAVRLGADFDGDGKPESNSVCHALGDFFIARYYVKD